MRQIELSMMTHHMT